MIFRRVVKGHNFPRWFNGEPPEKPEKPIRPEKFILKPVSLGSLLPTDKRQELLNLTKGYVKISDVKKILESFNDDDYLGITTRESGFYFNDKQSRDEVVIFTKCMIENIHYKDQIKRFYRENRAYDDRLEKYKQRAKEFRALKKKYNELLRKYKWD